MTATEAPSEGVKQDGPKFGGPTFSFGHRLQRFIWMTAWAMFAAWTPPPCHAWRRLVLRIFGAQLHPTARIYGSVRVWWPKNLVMGSYATLGPGVECYNIAPVTLETLACVSQRAHLCTGTHDVDDPDHPLRARPITIKANAWIAAEAFVGPGVTVGEGAVLGARGVIFRDMTPWTIFTGNPALPLRMRKRLN